MARLDLIVAEINKAIEFDSSRIFDNPIQLNGLVKPIYKDTEIIPCLQDANLTQVVFSDKFNFQLYHKIMNGSTEIDFNKPNSPIKETADLTMIIYTKYPRLDILEYLTKVMPNLTKSILGITQLSTRILDYSFNEQSIFREERGALPYQLNQKHNLIKINYKAVFSYYKNC